MHWGSSNISRRQWLGGAAAALVGCRREAVEAHNEPPPLPPLPPATSEVDAGRAPLRYVRRELSLPGTVSPKVIALVPESSTADAGAAEPRYPVVIALHGRGEALKGAQRGPLGWPDDYALERALVRVVAPPLRREDFFGLVTPDELTAHNDALAARPFRGLIVLCPYLPDLPLQERAPQDRYARFLIDTLLPHAQRELPALAGRAHTGIDGISLGGAVALHIGAGFPEAFGAVSGMQPAIGSRDARAWAERLGAAHAKAGGSAVRLLTSEGDPFKRPTRRLHEELEAIGLSHEFAVTPGPHDYVYNRGPASYALLTFHDRVLA